MQMFFSFLTLKVLAHDKKITIKEVSIFIATTCAIIYFHHTEWHSEAAANLLNFILSAIAWLFGLFAYAFYEKKFSLKTSLTLMSASTIIIISADHLVSFIRNLVSIHNHSNWYHGMNYQNHYLGMLLIGFFAFTFAFLLAKFSQKFQLRVKENESLKTLIMIASLIVLSTFYGSIILGMYHGNTIELIQLNLLFFIVYLFITVIVFIFYTKISREKYAMQRKQDEEKALQQYAIEVERQYHEVQKFKQDYQSILTSIDAYIHKEDLEGLRQYYLKEITPQSKHFSKNEFRLENLSKVNVSEIKSILAVKLMTAQESGLDVRFEAVDEINIIPMDSFTLVRTLGILLDNAIEALIELEKGQLQVGVMKNKASITFVIQNTCSLHLPPLHQLKQPGYSTKGLDRGLGLSNLAELAKHHPKMLLDTRIIENQFIQKVTVGGGV